MARKALRECSKAGCHELTRERYCAKHKAEYDRAASQRHQEYDRTTRDKPAAEFYKSKEWQRARAEAMARSLYLCQDCLARGVIKKAEMVHHIKPLREYPRLALDQDNLKPLCNKCHGKY